MIPRRRINLKLLFKRSRVRQTSQRIDKLHRFVDELDHAKTVERGQSETGSRENRHRDTNPIQPSQKAIEQQTV